MQIVYITYPFALIGLFFVHRSLNPLPQNNLKPTAHLLAFPSQTLLLSLVATRIAQNLGALPHCLPIFGIRNPTIPFAAYNRSNLNQLLPMSIY